MNRDESGKERRGERERKREEKKEKGNEAGFLSWTEGSWKLQKAAVKCETKKGRTNRAMGKAKLWVHPRGTKGK